MAFDLDHILEAPTLVSQSLPRNTSSGTLSAITFAPSIKHRTAAFVHCTRLNITTMLASTYPTTWNQPTEKPAADRDHCDKSAKTTEPYLANSEEMERQYDEVMAN